jgi:hypothetical protein
LILALSIFGGGTAVAADFAEPGDLLYSLDLTIEHFRLDMAPDSETAARIHLENATERLEEAENKLNEGDIENGNVALEAYEREMATLANLVGKGNGLNRDQLADLLEAAYSKHISVLEQLLEKVPEPGKNGIRRALEASSISKKNLQKGSHEDLPKGPPEDKTTGPPEDKRTGKPEDKPKDKSKNKPTDKP